MGLTIHYSLSSRVRSAARARAQVEAVRQLALDLPFDAVGEVKHYGPEVCSRPLEELRGTPEFDVLLDCGMYVSVPWNRKQHMSAHIHPVEVFHFFIEPADGSEWAGIALARYPTTTLVTYRVRDDDRFIRTIRDGGSTRWEYDYRKFHRWADKHPLPGRFGLEGDYTEERAVPTRLASGWRHSAFCKTQYASDPECGGPANFLRAHVSLITLLERAGALPGLTVAVDDEGHFGASNHSDDWAEARAAGREPTYVDHPATHSVPTLLRQLGDYNTMVAAVVGTLKDTLGGAVEAPILDFADFEALEFRGCRDEALQPFLAALRATAPAGA